MIAAPSVQKHEPEISGGAAASVREGRLNGRTILRYAHASGSAGGLEQYLSSLNRALGERNHFTTIQLEISCERDRLAETVESHAGCRLIKVPLFVEQGSLEKSVSGNRDSASNRLKSWFAGRLFGSPFVYQAFTRHYLRRRRIPCRPGEPRGAGLKIAELAGRFDIDLVVLHSGGGADASEIIGEAKKAGIPVVLVHHFANDRLAGFSLRQQVSEAAGVAGVCGTDVPGYLRARFCNVSDGVDTGFFRSDKARPLPQKHPAPILFLPARITPAKGQADLLKVASLLQKRGIPTTAVFAGRVDSPVFEMELRKMAERDGLTGRVEFIGQLDAQQLRDWYAAARVLVFPTYHHEGLPRILMECQSMGLPPVVYDIGGTSEGISDGRTGILIPQGNFQRMADAVETLLKDDALCTTMSQAGRRFVEERFSLPALARRHEDFCLRVPGFRANSASLEKQPEVVR